MHLTWLDNNSWLIEMAGKRILLDPWLVGPLVFGNQSWLLKGIHTHPPAIPEAIDLLLLSQGLEDHAHPQTLSRLDKTIPVVASPNAATVAEKLGFTQITALAHGDRYAMDRLQIQAFPGAPIGPFLTENGYLLSDRATQTKLYYEPHGYHDPSLQDYAPVEVVITPIVDLKIPVLGPVIRGKESAPQVADWLQPQVLIPTAAGGDVQFDGVLTSVLQSQGSAAETRSHLTQQELSTRLIEPKPGDRFEVALVTSQH